jgi:hypothetical protein
MMNGQDEEMKEIETLSVRHDVVVSFAAKNGTTKIAPGKMTVLQ